MTYQTITMRQLDEYMECCEDMLMIDLRDPESFHVCHIMGAINIPYEELEQSLRGLPEDRLLTFYCYRGGQSMLACNRLSRLGFRVLNIANGLCCYQGKYLVKQDNLH